MGRAASPCSCFIPLIQLPPRSPSAELHPCNEDRAAAVHPFLRPSCSAPKGCRKSGHAVDVYLELCGSCCLGRFRCKAGTEVTLKAFLAAFSAWQPEMPAVSGHAGVEDVPWYPTWVCRARALRQVWEVGFQVPSCPQYLLMSCSGHGAVAT